MIALTQQPEAVSGSASRLAGGRPKYRQLFSNMGSLYVAHFASYLLPLVTIPVLARRLGPGAYGTLAAFQGIAFYANILIEFGFGLSATREVSQNRSDSKQLGHILSSVLAAKAVLTIAAWLGLLALGTLVPALKHQWALLGAAMIFSLGQSVSMSWFFLGLESVRLTAICDLSGRLLSTLLLLRLVRQPEDAWLSLALPGVGALLAALVPFWLAAQMFPLSRPSLSSIWQTLRGGWVMFLSRSVSGFTNASNVLILSFYASPEIVGYFSAGERINRSFIAALFPACQALYPRLSFLVKVDREGAARLIRRVLSIMLLIAVAVFAIIYVSAPLLVQILLGPGFDAAATALRILSGIILFRVVADVLGLQWMVPLGHERAFGWITLLACAVNLILASILAPRFQQNGMAMSALSSEVLIAVAITIYLLFIGIFPVAPRWREKLRCAEVAV